MDYAVILNHFSPEGCWDYGATLNHISPEGGLDYETVVGQPGAKRHHKSPWRGVFGPRWGKACVAGAFFAFQDRRNAKIQIEEKLTPVYGDVSGARGVLWRLSDLWASRV